MAVVWIRLQIFIGGNLNLIRTFDGTGNENKWRWEWWWELIHGKNGTMGIKSPFLQTAGSESVLLDSTLYGLSRPLEPRTRCALSHKYTHTSQLTCSFFCWKMPVVCIKVCLIWNSTRPISIQSRPTDGLNTLFYRRLHEEHMTMRKRSRSLGMDLYRPCGRRLRPDLQCYWALNMIVNLILRVTTSRERGQPEHWRLWELRAWLRCEEGCSRKGLCRSAEKFLSAIYITLLVTLKKREIGVPAIIMVGLGQKGQKNGRPTADNYNPASPNL